MRKNRQLSILTIIVVCFTLVIQEVTGQVKTKLPSKEVAKLIKNFKSKKKHTESGAVILLKDGQMTVDNDGTSTVVVHVVGKIITKDAASDYSQIAIPISSYYEDVNLDFAYTIEANGKIISVSKDAIQLKTLPQEYNVKSYSNTKLLTFTLPALDEGSVFEYQTTKKIKPYVNNKFAKLYSFNYVLYNPSKYGIPRIDPVYKSTFILKVPEGEELVYSMENLVPKPVITNRDAFSVYTWSVNDLPDIIIESKMPPLNEKLSRIRISSFQSWPELDGWANKLFSSNISLNENIKVKAKEIINKSKTEEEKIWKLASFMGDKIKYVSAHLGNSGYEPHCASDTLNNRYGDCKDHVTLFISLLKAIGINSFPALINPRPYIEENTDIPSPYFSHVITYIPRSEGDLWIDTSSGFDNFPTICWANHDLMAFVIDGKGGKFLRTPPLKVEDNQVTNKYAYHFNKGAFKTEMAIELKGALSSYYKSLFKNLTEKEQEDLFHEISGDSNSDENITKYDFSDLDNPTIPFEMTLQYERKDVVEKIIRHYTYAGEAEPIEMLFPTLYHLPEPETRINDYIFGFKIRLTEEYICPPPPDGFNIDVLPEDESLNTEMVSFHKKFSRQDNTIKVQTEFCLKKARIESKDYEQFYKSIQDVLEKWKWHFVFTRKKIDEKSKILKDQIQKQPEDPKALLDLSKHYLTKAKYNEAMELLKKAIKIEPDNGAIHYYLGIALSYMDRYEEAEDEFKKANELGYRP